jgi:hypothetical protein
MFPTLLVNLCTGPASNRTEIVPQHGLLMEDASKESQDWNESREHRKLYRGWIEPERDLREDVREQRP